MKTLLKLAFLTMLFFANPLHAQSQPPTANTTIVIDTAKTVKPVPAISVTPQVVAINPVYNAKLQEENAKEEDKPVVAYPGTIVKFTINNPMLFLNSRPSDQSKVVLYVNGIEMKGITSDWMNQISSLQLSSGKAPTFNETADIYLTLKRTDSTQNAWEYLYSNANYFYDRTAEINASIGWEGMSELNKAQNVPLINIVFYREIIFWAWLLLFLVVIAIFTKVAFFTDALRDGGISGAYSLSLTQLLFWTTLAIFAFIYCTVLTDIITSFNTSILLLLGISSGTTGIAYVIDSSYAQSNPGGTQKKHVSFLVDILSDGNGFSVQRIQTFAWNLVLGMYFIIYTFTNKSMPEFSTTLLFLAGISSASYLSAKGPENINARTPVTAGGGNPVTESVSSGSSVGGAPINGTSIGGSPAGTADPA